MQEDLKESSTGLSEVDIIEGVTAMSTAKISTEQAAAEKLETIKRQKLKENY